MRASRLLIPTLKETPADAEIVSHQLMLRAGMIRKVAAGIYDWLPLGLRVLRKVESIVREEMDRAGAQEMLMPAVQPAELWQESKRWDEYGPELLRFQDRHQREFCFGPTHEEIITALVRNEIRSYRQLPLNFYQIQTKFRDEIRPRFGVMRAREFMMKDAYSFHTDQTSLQQTYDQMYDAYARVFTRIGLKFCAVEADTGAIGGSTSHEFHVLAESGEDAIAFCDKYGYAANVELAPALPPMGKRKPPSQPMTEVDTPGQHTIDDVASFLNIDPAITVKTLLVRGVGGAVALVLRGDHELNIAKTEKLTQVSKPLEFVSDAEVEAAAGCAAGSIGPVGLHDIPVIADESAVRLSDFVCGANENGKHLTGVNWGRDVTEPEVADLRKVVDGDPCPAQGAVNDADARITIKRGIEVGHIFQLGTKYSEAMNAVCLDERGDTVVMPMGCYGIGVSRIVAAAIEQNHDANGIIWPDAIAPFEVVIIPIGAKKSEQVAKTAEKLYNLLSGAGMDVMLDDRDERPGVMFAEAELIGIPHRFVVSERGIQQGTVEYKPRSAGEQQELPIEDVLDTLSTIRESIA